LVWKYSFFVCYANNIKSKSDILVVYFLMKTVRPGSYLYKPEQDFGNSQIFRKYFGALEMTGKYGIEIVSVQR